MQVKTNPYHYSVEEYLRLEDTAEEKSEYCNGEFFTIAGGAPNHTIEFH